MIDSRLELALWAGASGSTLMMAGLCWFVQLVAYPMLSEIARGGPEVFARCHALHVRKITWFVAPAMLTEAGTTVALLVLAPGALTWACAALLALLWAATFGVHVPMHERLGRHGFEPALHRRLVSTNWIRTVGWTVKGALLLAMVPAMVL
ncbi:MAG: hypothetical protein SFY95_01575 [Planctomycetota bacterium]|nr:hypothetical protein [Planctomycetota bacterium]